MVGAIDSASLAILLSIGHQTKLFDTLAELPPATSAQIADAVGLNERYVREWLGGVVTCRVVDYDPASQTYSLPRHRAAVLTRAAGPDNLARVAQFIPMLGEVEQKIIGCFHGGGGLSYSEYPRFHKVMAEESGEVFDAALVDVILPMADGLPDRLRAGVDVADIGCGSGHAINVMAEAFPASRFTGIDFSEEGLAVGAAEARSRADQRDVRCGGCCCPRRDRNLRRHNGFRRDPRPGPASAGVAEHLSRAAAGRGTPDGRRQGVEPTRGQHRCAPRGIPYTVSTMHCMSVSLGLDGAGLGTCWGRQLATSMLADAGFTEVAVHEIESDPINFYYVARKTPAGRPTE